MRSFKALYDKGSVAVVQGVGYPNADHSHFRSSEIWQTAAPERYEHTGWLGRYLDEAGLPEKNLFNAVAVSQVLPEALVANHTDVPTIANLAQYGLIADSDPMSRQAFSQNSRDQRLPFAHPICVTSWRSKTTPSAVPKKFRSSSRATRRWRRTRLRRSAAA